MEISYAALTVERFGIAEVLKTKCSWLCLKQSAYLLSEDTQCCCLKNLLEEGFLILEKYVYKRPGNNIKHLKFLANKSFGLYWILS